MCYNIEIITELREESLKIFFLLFHFTNTTNLKLMEYYGLRVTAASTPLEVRIVDTFIAG